jgi:DNA-binding protein HU-beta
MGKSLSKKELIAELSETTEVTQKTVKNVLDRLAKIAYRETVNGFTVPGICKLKIARRKESKCRNPTTGELMLIAEHEIVKITPLKKAKDAIAPKTEDLVTVIEEPVEQNASAPEPEQDDLFTFVCSTCGQEIEAPNSMRGMEAECPTCGNDLIIGESKTAEPNVTEDKEVKTEEQPPVGSGTNTMRLDLSNLGFD